MSGTGGEKLIRVIAFSGKKVDWQAWSEKFLARARRKGFKGILLGSETPPKASEDLKGDAEKERLRELNEIAFEDLILSINGETDVGRVAFQIVRGSKTADLPDGSARLAWEKLNKKFASKTAPSRLNLKNKFAKSKLKKKSDDPDVWLSELEDLQTQLILAGSRMEDDEVLEHALNNLPDVHETVVSKLEDRLGAANDPLTMEDLRDALNLKHERMGYKPTTEESDDDDDDEGKDTALHAGGFRGKCRTCGKWGHKSVNCREPKDDASDENGRRFNGKCWCCGKEGYREEDCRTKKRDEESSDTADVALFASAAAEKNAHVTDSATEPDAKAMKLCFDVSTIKSESFGGSKHWLLIVDEERDCCWSYFLRTKQEVGSKLWNLIGELNNDRIAVTHLKCNNAGENAAAQEFMRERDDSVILERRERNEICESKFETLCGCVRSMLDAAGADKHLRGKLWAECANMATNLENDGDDRNDLEFGDIGVENRDGKNMMFVGYGKEDTCRALDLKTRRIVLSRDHRWLGMKHQQWIRKGEIENENGSEIENEEDVEHESEIENEEDVDCENENEIESEQDIVNDDEHDDDIECECGDIECEYDDDNDDEHECNNGNETSTVNDDDEAADDETESKNNETGRENNDDDKSGDDDDEANEAKITCCDVANEDCVCVEIVSAGESESGQEPTVKNEKTFEGTYQPDSMKKVKKKPKCEGIGKTELQAESANPRSGASYSMMKQKNVRMLEIRSVEHCMRIIEDAETEGTGLHDRKGVGDIVRPCARNCVRDFHV